MSALDTPCGFPLPDPWRAGRMAWGLFPRRVFRRPDMRGAGAAALVVMGSVPVLAPMVFDHLHQRLILDFYGLFGPGTNLPSNLQDSTCNPEYRLLYVGLGLAMILARTVLSFVPGPR